MPEGGIISISCANKEVDLSVKPSVSQNQYIEIIIKDNGIGIHTEHSRKYCRKFFTE